MKKNYFLCAAALSLMTIVPTYPAIAATSPLAQQVYEQAQPLSNTTIEQTYQRMAGEDAALLADPAGYQKLIQEGWVRYGDSKNLTPSVEDVLKSLTFNNPATGLSPEIAQDAVAAVLSTLSTPDANSLVQAPELIGALISVLQPYASQAGKCKPTTDDDQDIVCSYTIGNTAADYAVAVSDENGNPLIVNRSTDFLLPVSATEAVTLFDKITLKSNVSIQSAADAGGVSKKSGDCSFASSSVTVDCFYAFSYRTKSGWSSDKLWAEAVGTALLKPAAPSTISDTLLLDFPIVQRCGWSCRLKSLIKCADNFARNVKDGLVCYASNSSRENWTIHGANSYLQQVHAASCGLTRDKPENRSYFNDYQAGRYDSRINSAIPPEYRAFFMAGDFRLQTNNQIPPQSSTDASGGDHLFPRPTTSRLDNGLPALAVSGSPTSGTPRWTHQLYQINGWQPNIIFAAVNATANIPLGTQCQTVLSHPARSDLNVRGNLFQVYHGTASGDFPAWDIIVGWDAKTRQTPLGKM